MPNILFYATAAVALSSTVAAQTFNNLNFDFTESAFTAGTLSGTTGYNIINDSTGVKLTSDNGDLDDLFISVSNTIPSNADGAHASVEFVSGGLKSSHGFTKNFSNTYNVATANNPGTLIKQTIRLTFASHISIQNFTTDFRSLNSAGLTWERSELAYLKKDGSYFSGAPSTGDYLTWQAANAGSPSSEQDSPSLGWWIAGSTGTVTNVGSDLTASGAGGSKENMTSTNGNSIMDYNDVGLSAGTEVGGFEWTVYVSDTRGQNNNQSSWTATQTFFEVSGAVPEPSSTLLLGVGFSGLILRRKRN